MLVNTHCHSLIPHQKVKMEGMGMKVEALKLKRSPASHLRLERRKSNEELERGKGEYQEGGAGANMNTWIFSIGVIQVIAIAILSYLKTFKDDCRR